MDRPSGETVLERKVHDLSCGMKDVTTASLVSLRTVAALELPRVPAATTRPKRPSSTLADGDGAGLAEGDCAADGVVTELLGDDGAFATG